MLSSPSQVSYPSMVSPNISGGPLAMPFVLRMVSQIRSNETEKIDETQTSCSAKVDSMIGAIVKAALRTLLFSMVYFLLGWVNGWLTVVDAY